MFVGFSPPQGLMVEFFASSQLFGSDVSINHARASVSSEAVFG